MGNLTLHMDALGNVTIRSYDSNGNLIYTQGPNNDFHKEFVYDFSNRLIREEIVCGDGLRLATSHKYDYVGNRIATIDIYGNETRHEYDAFHRPIKTILPIVLNENGVEAVPIMLREFDIMSNPTQVIDPRGSIIKTSYNIRGKPSLVEYADGTEQKNIYDIDGSLKESISSNGVITRYEYDYQERLIKKELFSPEGAFLEATHLVYDAFHLLSEVDKDGVKTIYKYDGAGRLVGKHRGSSYTTYAYDTLGRISKECSYYNAASYTVKLSEYDLLNRITEERVEESDGTILRKISYGYDSRGNRTEVIHYQDANPSITRTRYDFMNRPIEIIDPCGSVTTFFYNYQYRNELGQYVPYEVIIEPFGGSTTTIYDALNRSVCTLRKNPMGDIIQDRKFYYDLSGNLAKQVDRIMGPQSEDRYSVVTWKYNTSNREVECMEAFGEPEQKITRTTYNSKGQKQSILKPDGVQILYSYDAIGRVESYRSTDNTIHYVYTYDTKSNPIIVHDLVHNIFTKQMFDDENRLVCETLGNGLSICYCYDAQGRPIQVKLPDNTLIEYTYNAIDLKRVSRIRNGHQYAFNYRNYDLRGNLIESDLATLKYDPMGRITDISSDHWNAHDMRYDKMGNLIYRSIRDASGQKEYYYSYDALQQLIKEEGEGSHKYLYDSQYNRLQKNDKICTYNALHQIIDPSYLYDANGCLISRKDQQYSYDALDRLTMVIQGARKYTYLYDERNRRISKQLYRWNGSVWDIERTVRYIYTGANEIGSVEGDAIIELRILGVGKGAELGAAVAMEFRESVYFPTHDHNGNVVTLGDTSGNLYESYQYTAFGEEKINHSSGTLINPWRFSSKRVDEETGFVYFGRRYYDPDKGRWMTPDPAGYSEGPNLYAYVLNNPLTHMDLYGLMLAGNHGFFCQAVQYIGAALQFLGDHLLPIPVVRELVSFTGHVLANRNVSRFQPSSKYAHSENYCSDGPEGPQEEQVLHINGMLTSMTEAIERANSMSAAYGGINTHYTFNATHGFISDCLECLAQHFGLPTRSVDKCVDHIRARIQAAGGVNSGNRVKIHAHSQGGLILSRALEQLSGEEKKMLYINTYGSAKMISSQGLGSAVNYINSRDYVPYLSDLYGVIKGAFSQHYDIRSLPSSPNSIFDHNFETSNYWNIVSGAGREYVKEYGIISK